MERSAWLCALGAFLILLLFSSRTRGRLGERRALPMRYVSPLVLFCDDEALCRQALENAAWPDTVRIAKKGARVEKDDRLAVSVDATLELFPGWDRKVRKNAGKGAIVSHGIRRSLRALASPRPPQPLPLSMEGDAMECPDVRLLFGSSDLIEAAMSMIGCDDGTVASGKLLAHWLRECQLSLGSSEEEIAFEPGESRD